MGYTKRPGTEITNFWPDDTDTEIYIPSSGGDSLNYLLERAQAKWPGATLDNIEVRAEKIHTYCVYYDLYDAGDYTDFIILTYLG